MVKKILLYIFYVAITTIFAAFAAVYYGYKVKDRGQVQVSGELVEIPFEYTYSGHVKVWVTIDGKKYPFLLDSGGSNAFFTNKYVTPPLDDLVFRWFGLSMGSTNHLTIGTLNKLNEFEIENMRFEGFTFATAAFETNYCDRDVIGIIGKESMRHAIWKFLPRERKILVAKDISLLNISDSAKTIPLRKNSYGHQLKFRAIVNDTTKRDFLVDTGSNGGISFGINKRYILDANIYLIHGAGNTGIGGTNSKPNYVAYVDNLKTKDGFTIAENFIANANQNGFHSIGMGVLKEYDFTIDYKDPRLILESRQVSAFSPASYGFSLEYNDDEGVKVRTVVQGMDAHTKEVLPGMVISTINGKTINASNYCDLNFKGDSLLLEFVSGENVVVYKKQMFDVTKFND